MVMDFRVKTRTEVKCGSWGLSSLVQCFLSSKSYNLSLHLSSEIEINPLIEEDYSLLFLLVPEVP